MSLAGAITGALLAAGMLVLWRGWADLKVTRLEDRVLPYLRDVPGFAARAQPPVPVWQHLGLSVRGSALAMLTVPWPRTPGLGDRARATRGPADQGLVRRLERAGLVLTPAQFRMEQLLWGLGSFGLAVLASVLLVVDDPGRTGSLALACLLAGLLGFLARDLALGRQVAARERRMAQELPEVAGLLALSVAAGEGPVAGLTRVVARARGALIEELRRTLAEVHTGTPLAVSLDALAARTGASAVSRFARAVAVAVERGTPIAEVLHAQARDARESARAELLVIAARREIAMLVPVVFLILPTVVVFAFWPGLVGLRLTVP